MKETVRYRYRIRPGSNAASALLSEWHRTRYLWNDAVSKMKSGDNVSFAILSKNLTRLRAEKDWLKSGSAVAQQQELRYFAQSLSASTRLQGQGRPKYKSRSTSKVGLTYAGAGFSLVDGRLVLAKIPPIPVVWSRRLPSAPSSVRVYMDNLGYWYASFVVKREIESTPEADGSIGIDWGVKKTANTTNPEYDLEHLGIRRKASSELAVAQRKMARRKSAKGEPASKGYKRAKMQVAKISKKAQRRNAHEGRGWARRLVAAHQLIAVEDFKPKFLSKSSMARKASDASISTIKKTLIEYAERAGRKVVLVRPAYTTMTCSGCFARAKRLRLDERIFSCPSCGFTADRDENAARTILAVAERGHTSVEDAQCSTLASNIAHPEMKPATKQDR